MLKYCEGKIERENLVILFQKMFFLIAKSVLMRNLVFNFQYPTYRKWKKHTEKRKAEPKKTKSVGFFRFKSESIRFFSV